MLPKTYPDNFEHTKPTVTEDFSVEQKKFPHGKYIFYGFTLLALTVAIAKGSFCLGLLKAVLSVAFSDLINFESTTDKEFNEISRKLSEDYNKNNLDKNPKD